MAVRGGTNLNRILRVAAHLLFEKGQEVSDVYSLMQGFIDRSMLEKWFRAYRSVNAQQAQDTEEQGVRRIPMPPIDWDGVILQDLEAMKQSEQDWF